MGSNPAVARSITCMTQAANSTSPVFCFLKNLYVFDKGLLNASPAADSILQKQNPLMNGTGEVTNFTKIYSSGKDRYLNK